MTKVVRPNFLSSASFGTELDGVISFFVVWEVDASFAASFTFRDPEVAIRVGFDFILLLSLVEVEYN